MKGLVFLCAVTLLVAGGCSKESDDKIVIFAPKVVRHAKVNVGDSYADVLDKLGKPNINSVTQNSRVLIYDRVEVKIVNDAVSEVHDHR